MVICSVRVVVPAVMRSGWRRGTRPTGATGAVVAVRSRRPWLSRSARTTGLAGQPRS